MGRRYRRRGCSAATGGVRWRHSTTTTTTTAFGGAGNTNYYILSEGRRREGRRYFSRVLRMPAAPASTWARDSLVTCAGAETRLACVSHTMDVRSGVVWRGAGVGFRCYAGKPPGTRFYSPGQTSQWC